MLANGIFKALLLGDVYGDPGCRALFFGLEKLKQQYKPDFVIVNGENASGGFGLNAQMMHNFFDAGVDVITGGNHTWQQEDIIPCLDSQPRLLRPANYPSSNPGHGLVIYKDVAVINLQGRVNMTPIDCPFRTADKLIEQASKQTKLIFVDFHAENTVEKETMGFYLDGRVTAVVGTHTHVQTADEKILPLKTAYITDLGMTGPADSVIGSEPESSIIKQKTQMPYRPVVKEGAAMINGVCVTACVETGEALAIERFNIGFGG